MLNALSSPSAPDEEAVKDSAPASADEDRRPPAEEKIGDEAQSVSAAIFARTLLKHESISNRVHAKSRPRKTF